MMNNEKEIEKFNDRRYLTYQNMFWLFMIGNVLGVLLEGFFTLIKRGYWETHVVTIWGPFCLIYGIGAVGMYIGAVMLRRKNILVKFVVIASIATIVELLCGLLLEFGLGMRAWNYTRHVLNIRGHVSLKMTIGWGVIGLIFSYLIVSPLERLFDRLNGKGSKIACICLSIFMAINMIETLGCMIRWKQRHNGIGPKTSIGELIDKRYNDDKMAKRFVEWYFIDDAIGKR